MLASSSVLSLLFVVCWRVVWNVLGQRFQVLPQQILIIVCFLGFCYCFAAIVFGLIPFSSKISASVGWTRLCFEFKDILHPNIPPKTTNNTRETCSRIIKPERHGQTITSDITACSAAHMTDQAVVWCVCMHHGWIWCVCIRGGHFHAPTWTCGRPSLSTRSQRLIHKGHVTPKFCRRLPLLETYFVCLKIETTKMKWFFL